MASRKQFEFEQAGSSFYSSFESMYRSGKLTDVTIKIGGRFFRAHRIVLSAVFPYFDAVFERSREEEITLRNVDAEAIKCLLDFAYTGSISIDSGNVKQLLKAANYLQHMEVRQGCFEFLSGQLTPENVLDLRALGSAMNCNEFMRKTDSFITENFDAFRKTQAFLNMPFEVLKQIISRAEIVVKKTENVYKAISRWAKADPGRITKFIGLVECVEKKLTLPDKRRKKRRKLYISQMLLDTLRRNEDAFGIYTISAIGSYNRVVYNYNSYTSKWLRVSQHSQPRSFMTVVSACGLIFAFTGENLEVFDRHSWTPYGVLPWKVKNRSGHPVSLGDKIYWFPNSWGEDCSVWCFNVESEEWKEGVQSPKLHNPGVVSLQRYIYVLGGYKCSKVTDEAVIYDPEYEDFTEISPMGSKRAGPQCAALNDKVYVCGGYGGESLHLITAEVYDASKNEWQFISLMKKIWTDFSVVPCEGKLFLIGRGYGENGTVEIYDPEENEWESGPEFPYRSESLKAVVLSM